MDSGLEGSVGIAVPNDRGSITIRDDEPAAKAVTITSEGDAVHGDRYFVVVAASTSTALGLSDILTTTQTAPVLETLVPIGQVPEILVKMHGLGEVRSKAVTHAWLTDVPRGQPFGPMELTFDLVYGTGTTTVTTTLDVVAARTSRNFFLFPGPNLTGLALVPDDPSIANLMQQPVLNASTEFETTLGRPVKLSDVIKSVSSYEFDRDGGWVSFDSPDPLSGDVPAEGGLIEMRPHQGMLIETRETVSAPGSDQAVEVFDSVDVAGFDSPQPVPIKMTVRGSYLGDPISGSFPPLIQELRAGWNLVAPHLLRDAAFHVAFRAALLPIPLVSRAFAYIRDVVAEPVPATGEISVSVISSFSVATYATEIDPRFSYWLRVPVGTSGGGPVLAPVVPESIDVRPPLITEIAVSAESKRATITWRTNEPATSQVEYGATPALGTTRAQVANLVNNHSVTLIGLNGSTTYYFRVSSRDSSANEAVEPDPLGTFTTAEADITAPVISGIVVSLSSTEATITWNTDEPSTSQVTYGTTTGLGSLSALDGTPATAHSITLTGLARGTTYYYKVMSADLEGNLAVEPVATDSFVAAGFSDDFESGDLSRWTSSLAEPGNVAQVTTTAARNGSFGLFVGTASTNDDAYLRKQISPETEIYTKVSVRLASDVSQGDHLNFAAAATGPDGSTVGSLTIRRLPGDLNNNLYTFAAGSFVDSGFNFVLDNWYCVETQVSVSPTIGRVRVWVDGFLEVDRQGLNTGTLPVSWLRLGADGATVDSGFLFDDFEADTVQIGCQDTPEADRTAPTISDIAFSPGIGAVTITWTTDEPATSQVEFGTTALLGSFTALGQSFVTSHAVTLTGIAPEQTYYYQVISKDDFGNAATAPDPPTTFEIPVPNPLQVHLSTSTGDPSTEVTFTWRTGSSTVSFARFGIAPSDYQTTTQSLEYSYPDLVASSTVEGMQVAQVTGLVPDTRYYYQVGSDTDGWSTEYSFKTALPKGNTSTFSFIAYADHGTEEQGVARRPRAVAAAIEATDPDLVLLAGDVYYCDDQVCVDIYFGEVLADVASQAYFMTAAGNHEYFQPDDLITYTSRFNYPGRPPGEICVITGTRCPRNEVPELWYSFDWGNVHFISINTGVDHGKPFSGSEEIKPGEAQYEWFKADLEAASADPDIDWTVVYAHYNLYNWGKDPSHSSDDEARAVFEPLVQQNGVDVWLAGHQHSYERTLPVGNSGASVDTASCGTDPYSTCTNPLYPIYFTVGMGGRSLYDEASTCGGPANCDTWSVVKTLGSFGFTEFTVNDQTMSMEFIDVDGNVLDQVTIVK